MNEHFGKRRLASITVDELAKFQESWKVSNITARKQLERLRMFFKFSIGRRWVDFNPAKELAYPPDVEIEPKPFEKDELEKITWAIPLFSKKGIYGEDNRDRVKAFTLALRWTGLRIRDVVQLRRSMVDKTHITLRAHKNNKPIKILMHADLKEALANLSNTGDYYFWSGLGNAKSCVGDWQRALRRLSDLSGVHVHAHRFRHTLATDRHLA
jgi:integrase